MNYYIQGNEDKADQIKSAFEKILGRTVDLPFEKESVFFYTVNIQGKSCIRTFDTTYYLVDIIKTHPDYKELELPIEPCFKVGDKIEATIYGIKRRVTIRAVDKTYRCYFGTLEECIGFSEQDQWHLAPKPHYNISNFNPFDKVLVRQDDSCTWGVSFFSRYDGMFLCCSNVCFTQCIPFNDDTKRLLGTADMCSEEYINW